MKAGDLIAGRYRLEAPLGEGGVGVVWIAVREDIDRRVALKVLKGGQDDEQRQRFRIEASALARLDHPNCLVLFDYGHTDDGEPFLVTEHLRGRPLSVLRGEQLSIDRIMRIAAQMADVLAYVHGQGVVHRDLKPENVLLVETPDGELVKVLDFGIAKLSDAPIPDITKTGEVFGTPAYMSPEQLRGTREAGAASDFYSLGVMLYELIEGRLPFEGRAMIDFAVGHLVNEAPPITRGDCPAMLRTLVSRMLVKDPETRLSSADELVATFRGLPTVRDSVVALPSEPTGGAPIRWLAAGVAVLGAVAAAIFLLPDEPQAPRPIPPVVLPRPTPVTHETPTRIVPDDAPADVAEPLVGASRGCGREPLELGRSTVGGLTTYVPPEYEPNHPYPVILLIPHKWQTPEQLLAASGFEKLAARERFILLTAKYRTEPDVWKAYLDEQTAPYFCVDLRRVFVVGDGYGARLSNRFSCEPWVTAVAGNSLLFGKDHEVHWQCTDTPKPAIWLTPTQSLQLRTDGAPNCTGDVALALAEFETRWRSRNGCRIGSREAFRHPAGECHEWACDVPFRSCVVNGGFGWPGSGAAGSLEPSCMNEPPPGDFPSAEQVWAFFDAVPALEPR